MVFIKSNLPIYLASGSPRRKELMQQLGIKFAVLNVEIDESVEPNETAEDYICRVAKEKAWQGLKQLNSPHAIVIGGDTSIVLENCIIGKPSDAAHAGLILEQLSGREHVVLSAVAIASPSGLDIKVNKTVVEFKALSSQEIDNYIATGEPFGKAGAYAIQGFAAVFVKSIHGSYSGVMGLPLFELSQMLQSIQE